jgi:hypothetical protein
VGATNLLGAKTTTTGNFVGMIDDLQVWNRSISAVEVGQIYRTQFSETNMSKFIFATNQSNLTAGNYTYYACMADSSGSSNCTSTYALQINGTTPEPPACNCVIPASGNFNLDCSCNCNVGNYSGSIDYIVYNGSGTVSFNNVSLTYKGMNSSGTGAYCNFLWQNYSITRTG